MPGALNAWTKDEEHSWSNFVEKIVSSSAVVAVAFDWNSFFMCGLAGFSPNSREKTRTFDALVPRTAFSFFFLFRAHANRMSR